MVLLEQRMLLLYRMKYSLEGFMCMKMNTAHLHISRASKNIRSLVKVVIQI